MPYLPATILGASAYERMFYGCTSLTSVIDLPATILGASAYAEMFKGCYNITSVPSVLPGIKGETDAKFAYFSCLKVLTAIPSYASFMVVLLATTLYC